MLSPLEHKKDSFLSELQAVLGKGLTALGNTLSNLIQENNPDEEPNPNLTILAEAGKLLCQVHHTISNHRKFQLYPRFNTKIQKVAAAQVIDASLFGEDFAEKCKNIKTFESTAKELQKPGSSSKNFKRPASNTRWKPSQKGKYRPKNNFYNKDKDNRRERRMWRKR